MRRVVTFAASVVFAGLAVLLTWVSKLPKAPLDLVTAAGSAAAVLTAGTSDRIKQEFTRLLDPQSPRAQLLKARFLTDSRGRRPPRVRDVGAVDLGVHEAEPIESGRSGSAGGTVPPYVRRDVHPWLVERISSGGFVLIEGRSAVGKSRLAFQAMREAVPEHRLLVPDDGKALAELAALGRAPERSLIWLDDLERFLGSDGLARSVLDRLCPPGTTDVTVLATLRLEERRARVQPADDSAGRELSQLVADVLSRAQTLDSPIAPGLTASERERARASADSRIAHAVERSEQDGFGATLCGGPAVVKRFKRAEQGENLAGAAVVAVVVDARRTGYLRPLPSAALKALYLGYVPEADRYRHDLPTFEQAMDWAVTREHGTSCLIPRADGTYEPFDYLTDYIQSQYQRQVKDIPDQVWDTISTLTEPDMLLRIGVTAYNAKLFPRAEKCFRSAAAAGLSEGWYDLGIVLRDVGRTEEAEAAYRQAAEAGDTNARYNLGVLFREAGRTEEAEAAYRQAAEAGDTDAMNNLGDLLHKAGRTEEAEAAYRQAIAAGHAYARYNLGNLLRETGRTKEAEAAYRQAAGAGDTNAGINLGILLRKAGRTEEAEAAYRQAIAAGDTRAGFNLGILLREAGRTEEAEAAYRQAAEAGHVGAANNLGILLYEAGRTEEAEAAYRQAAEAGDTNAGINLGILLRKAGRTEEAEAAYRQAERDGESGSRSVLG